METITVKEKYFVTYTRNIKKLFSRTGEEKKQQSHLGIDTSFVKSPKTSAMAVKSTICNSKRTV